MPCVYLPGPAPAVTVANTNYVYIYSNTLFFTAYTYGIPVVQLSIATQHCS